MKKVFALLLVLALLLCGCDAPAGEASGSPDSTDTPAPATADPSVESSSPTASTPVQSDADMFTDRDGRTSYDESSAVLIHLNGDSATSSSNSVQISGSTVTITEEATYILSGTLNDGMIVVNAGKKAKLQLVLNGVNINSETSAALYILQADKVFVTLAEGTSNTLSNGGSFAAVDSNNIDGAVFSKHDLTFNGSGGLTVVSPAGHGIVCKDDLVFTGGAYTVQSASHGLDANDSVRITGASIAIDAGKDGIHAENADDTSLGFVYVSGGTLSIEAEGDGIDAGSYIQIEGGSFDILTGGGSVNGSKQTSDGWGGFMGGHGGMGGPGGMSGPGSSGQSAAGTTDDSSTSIKGLKAAANVLINGGSFTIDSADDAVHSNGDLTVNGGSFTIATGDDGFHADDTLTVNAGTINITESYEGLEALHVLIAGGDITLVSSDDGVNAAGGADSSGFGGNRGGDQFGGRGGMGGGMGGSSSNGTIVISGGNLNITAYGDGIDANGTLEITGGHTMICGPTTGDTATLDYDLTGVITGGTFIGTGASTMAQTFSSSEQGVIAVRSGNQAADTQITLADQSGNVIISHTPKLDFAVIILSSPDIVTGQTYTLTVGSISQEFTAS